MVNCSVSTCKKRSSTSNMRANGISYHIFPKDSLWRKQWIKFCNNGPVWKPSRNSVICSEHFTNLSWVSLSNKRRRLVDGAIPTVYPELGDGAAAQVGSSMETEENSGKIILGPGQIPTPSQIEKFINVHPLIRKLKQQLDLKHKKAKRLQSKVLYIRNKLTKAEALLKTLKMECINYRRMRLRMKKTCLNSAKHSKNQMIPSVKRVMVIKRALFNSHKKNHKQACCLPDGNLLPFV